MVNLEFLRSLRFRMLLGSLLLMLALFALVTVNTTQVLHTVAKEHLDASVRQISQTLNLAITPNTTREGLKTLNAYFQELVSGNETGIVYLAIAGERGHIIIKTASTPDPLPVTGEDLSEQLQTGVVHVSQPILIGESGVGTLHFGLATELYRSAINRIVQENAQLLVFTMLSVMATLLWVHIRINQRVTRLMQASLALAHGHYSLRAPEGGHDELSRLAQRFNLMADAVRERVEALECRRAEIRELNLNLEKRVEERTLELAETVERLKKTQESLVQSEKLA
ncbi:MAG: HAMP domain-containing protein, partial [Pseudomonadota bacterium]